MLFQYSAA